MLSAAGCSTIRDARQAQRDELPPRPFYEFTETNRLTLTAAETISLDWHPDLITATQDIVRAEISLHQAGVNMRPILTSSVGYGGGTSGSSRNDWTFHSSDDTLTVGLGLSWVLYDFGRTSANQRQATANLISSCESYRNTIIQRFYQVRSAFFILAEAREQCSVAEENLAQYDLLLREAEERLNAGKGIKYDVSKARTSRASAFNTLITASNAIYTAQAELVKQLSIETDAPIFQENAELPSPPEELSRLIDMAMTNQPTLRVLREKVSAASAGVDYAIADLYPELAISVDPRFSATSAAEMLNISWGASLAQSLFRGWMKEDNLKQAKAQLWQAKAALVEQEQQVRSDIVSALADLQSYRTLVQAAGEMVVEAKENFDIVKESLDVGVSSILALTDAQVYYVRARVEHVAAVYNVEKSKARLFSILGVIQ